MPDRPTEKCSSSTTAADTGERTPGGALLPQADKGTAAGGSNNIPPNPKTSSSNKKLKKLHARKDRKLLPAISDAPVAPNPEEKPESQAKAEPLTPLPETVAFVDLPKTASLSELANPENEETKGKKSQRKSRSTNLAKEALKNSANNPQITTRKLKTRDYDRILEIPFFRNSVLFMGRSSFENIPLLRVPFRFLDPLFFDCLDIRDSPATKKLLHLLCEYFGELTEKEEQNGISPQQFQTQSNQFREALFLRRDILYAFFQEVQSRLPKIQQRIGHLKADMQTRCLQAFIKFLPHISEKMLESLQLGGCIGDAYLDLQQLDKHGYLYLGQNKMSGKKSTLYLLPPEEMLNINNIENFLVRADRARQLNHESLVNLQGYGGYIQQGQYFIETELVEGCKFEEWLQSNPWPQNYAEAIDILVALCELLQYLHHENLFHNSLDVANVTMVGPKKIKLFNFNLQTAVHKPYYIPPEGSPVEDTGNVDQRSDMYSLGILMYEMLTAHAPPQGNSGQMLVDVAQQTTIPLWLTSLINKLTQKEKSKRLESANGVKWVLCENHPNRAVFFLEVAHDIERDFGIKDEKFQDELAMARENIRELARQLYQFTGEEIDSQEILSILEKKRLILDIENYEWSELKNIPPFLTDRCPNRGCGTRLDEQQDVCPQCGTPWKISCPHCGKFTHAVFNECQHSYPPHPIPFEEKIIYNALVSARQASKNNNHMIGVFYLTNLEKSLREDPWLKAEKQLIYRDLQKRILHEFAQYRDMLFKLVEEEKEKERQRIEAQRALERSQFLEKLNIALHNDQYIYALEILENIPSVLYNEEVEQYHEQVCSYLCRNYFSQAELLVQEGGWSAAIAYLQEKIPAQIQCKAVDKKIKEIENELRELVQEDVAKLIDRLKSDDISVRESAIFKLAEIGEPAIPKLIPILKDRNLEVRETVAQILSRMESKAIVAIPLLVKELNNSNWWVRESVIQTLDALAAYITNPIPELLQLLKDGNWSVRKACIYALEKIESQRPALIPELNQCLNDEVWVVRVAALEVMEKINLDTSCLFPILLQCLSDKAPRVRLVAIRSLQKLGAQSKATITQISQLLEDKNVEVKQAAIEFLGNLGNKARDAVPMLITLLMDEDLYVVEAVGEALASIGEFTVSDVTQVLKDKAAGSRLAKVDALWHLQGNVATEVVGLVETLKNKNGEAILPTIRALARTGPEAAYAIPALTRALKDEIWQVREATALALANIGVQADVAVPALLHVLEDKIEDVREAAQKAIEKIRGEPFILSEMAHNKDKKLWGKLRKMLRPIYQRVCSFF